MAAATELQMLANWRNERKYVYIANMCRHFVLSDRCLKNRGIDPDMGRGLLQHGGADDRDKVKPDMMAVELTASEQQTYAYCGSKSAYSDNAHAKWQAKTNLDSGGRILLKHRIQ